ncbi:MAG: heavy metal translocating P-type ATPase [Anaerolineae bacterium]
MKQAEFSFQYLVQGLDCLECATSLEQAVSNLPGVRQSQLNYMTARLLVQAEKRDDLQANIRKLAASMGYQLHAVDEVVVPTASTRKTWLLAHRTFVLVAAMSLLLILAFILRWTGVGEGPSQILFLSAILIGGIPLLKRAGVALVKAHKMDMNVLMAIAVIGAVALGDLPEGAVTLLLLMIGELLEELAANRARKAISSLMSLTPSVAMLLAEEGQRQVPTGSLQVGDSIVVRPGERLPMDGFILEGQSELEEAAVTGESLPVEKGVGATVYAGTINGQGALVVRVTKLVADNTLNRIIKLVEEAQSRQAPAQRFIDRFAAIYTPIVVIIALLMAVVPPLLGLGTWRVWIYRALVPLVVACPCALVLSTPVTIVSGLARAARSGVIIKGGVFLERLAQLKAIAFDKTGTLTIGKPRVVGGGCAQADSTLGCANCEDLIAKAAAVESRSEHALGKAVTDQAQALGVADRYPVAEGVQALPGRGISGNVNGHQVAIGSVSASRGVGEDVLRTKAQAAQSGGNTVLVIQDTCCDTGCYLSVADELRPQTRQMISDLEHLGVVNTVMLTGDNLVVAHKLAAQAGIADVSAGLLPEQKVTAVEELKERYGLVAMVGDGINDAPALAVASVGIAMGVSGTDVAVETADVALLSDDLMRIPWTIRLARRTMSLVKANIILALSIKAVFLVLALLGFANLWMAVLADTGSSLLVTANGLRAIRFPER